MVTKKWQAKKDCIDTMLSRIWHEVEDKAESTQITIEKTKRDNNVYNITVQYIEKE